MSLLEKIESILGDKILSSLNSTRNIVKTKKGKIFFLKIDNTQNGSLFCESQGLHEIKTSFERHHLYTPRIIHIDDHCLLMEYIPFHEKTDVFFESLGKGLAVMHKIEKENFGFKNNNYIGLNPQKNDCDSSWGLFFWEKRLLVQMAWLKDTSIEKELNNLRDIILNVLDNHVCRPSLLHGDLWGGNVCCGPKENPFLIDPAVYYGDRETDLAMSELFGGFSPAFYNAYRREFPLPLGLEQRKVIYNLYHLLNHLNLFGSSYLNRVRDSIEKIKKMK